MNDTTATILKMGGVTGAGWVISYDAIESVVRIASLTVPMVLSVLVFLQNRRKVAREEEKEKSACNKPK